jgi:predicted secreted protein
MVKLFGRTTCPENGQTFWQSNLSRKWSNFLAEQPVQKMIKRFGRTTCPENGQTFWQNNLSRIVTPLHI